MIAFYCMGRVNIPNSSGSFPAPDKWEKMPDGSRTCSYCGSLHEEDFIDILKHYVAGDPGYRFNLTTKTKGYKSYANRPGVQNAGQGGIKFYRHHVNPRGAKLEEYKTIWAAAVAKFHGEFLRR